jgi:hypothetical protein
METPINTRDVLSLGPAGPLLRNVQIVYPDDLVATFERKICLKLLTYSYMLRFLNKFFVQIWLKSGRLCLLRLGTDLLLFPYPGQNE